MQDTMNDIVIQGIDQFLPVQKAQREILKRVDDITKEAIEGGNPEIAFRAMEALLGISQISGLGFSKFAYTMKHSWKNFNQRDTFESRMEDRLGRGKKTVNDNIRVWEMLLSDEIPKEYREKFKTMPIRCLIPIANLWAQDWEVESNQWAELSNAPDPTTISKLIRKIKGVEPKSNALNIEWDKDNKSITGWKKGQPHTIYLQYDESDEVVMAVLERLLGGGKALEK